jgi:hypothetical protein
MEDSSDKILRPRKPCNWETVALLCFIFGLEEALLLFVVDPIKAGKVFYYYQKIMKSKEVFKMSRLDSDLIELRCKVSNEIHQLALKAKENNEYFVLNRNIVLEISNRIIELDGYLGISLLKKPHDYYNFLKSYQIFVMQIKQQSRKIVYVIDMNLSLFKWNAIVPPPYTFSAEGLRIFALMNFHVNTQENTIAEINSLMAMEGDQFLIKFQQIQEAFLVAKPEQLLPSLPQFWLSDTENISDFSIAKQRISTVALPAKSEHNSSCDLLGLSSLPQFFSQLNIQGTLLYLLYCM